MNNRHRNCLFGKRARMGKGTVTKGNANKNPEHSSSSPQPHQPPAHRIQSAHSDLLSGYGSLIFTDQIARGTKNIENYALKRTTQNKTLSIPSYSSASLSVQYFYHSYAFMSNHIDFFSISTHSTTYRISMPVFPARRNQLYGSAL